MDEMKKVAVVVEVNLTRTREQLAKLEESYTRDKKSYDDRIKLLSNLSDEDKSQVMGKEKAFLDGNEKQIGKAKDYIKDVEDGIEVEGEDRKHLKSKNQACGSMTKKQ